MWDQVTFHRLLCWGCLLSSLPFPTMEEAQQFAERDLGWALYGEPTPHWFCPTCLAKLRAPEPRRMGPLGENWAGD